MLRPHHAILSIQARADIPEAACQIPVKGYWQQEESTRTVQAAATDLQGRRIEGKSRVPRRRRRRRYRDGPVAVTGGSGDQPLARDPRCESPRREANEEGKEAEVRHGRRAGPGRPLPAGARDPRPRAIASTRTTARSNLSLINIIYATCYCNYDNYIYNVFRPCTCTFITYVRFLFL